MGLYAVYVCVCVIPLRLTLDLLCLTIHPPMLRQLYVRQYQCCSKLRKSDLNVPPVFTSYLKNFKLLTCSFLSQMKTDCLYLKRTAVQLCGTQSSICSGKHC
jgi:hypothetical protein